MSIDELKSQCNGISLGLFAADLGNLRRAAQNAAEWGCNILHFDIMDGVFVPGMIGGPGFVAAIDVGMLRDVHLMVQKPVDHVASYVKAGADMITIHAEATNAVQAISAIREAAKAQNRNVLAGFALMPDTALSEVAPLLALNPDMILVLSLDPRGTPADITMACARLRELRTLAPEAVLAFDGGVTNESITEIAACAPDMVVSGSAVLSAKKPKRSYSAMEKALKTTNINS